MTSEQFIARYAERAGMTIEDLRAWMNVNRWQVIPCECGAPDEAGWPCDGWQMVSAEQFQPS